MLGVSSLKGWPRKFLGGNEIPKFCQKNIFNSLIDFHETTSRSSNRLHRDHSGVIVLKTFFSSSLMLRTNKLECLFLESFFLAFQAESGPSKSTSVVRDFQPCLTFLVRREQGHQLWSQSHLDFNCKGVD